MSRRALVLTIAATLVASGCHGRRHSRSARGPLARGAAPAARRCRPPHPRRARGAAPREPALAPRRRPREPRRERPRRHRADLRDEGRPPGVSTRRARLFCLSRRDLTPRWVSTLRYAAQRAPGRERRALRVGRARAERRRVAAVVLAAERRGGRPLADAPAVRALDGRPATVSTAYLGSLGSPLDNKTLETVNLADGTAGWGYRTTSRIVATPTLDSERRRPDRRLRGPHGHLPPRRPGRRAARRRQLGGARRSGRTRRPRRYEGLDVPRLRGQLRPLLRHRQRRGALDEGLDGPDPALAVAARRAWSRRTSRSAPRARARRRSRSTTAPCSSATSSASSPSTPTPARRCSTTRRGPPPRPVGDVDVTIDTAGGAQLRKGKGLPVVDTVNLGIFDFLPTNSDGSSRGPGRDDPARRPEVGRGRPGRALLGGASPRSPLDRREPPGARRSSRVCDLALPSEHPVGVPGRERHPGGAGARPSGRVLRNATGGPGRGIIPA